MANRTTAFIEIGGELAESELHGLVKAIRSDGAGLDYGADSPDAAELRQALIPGERLRLFSNDAAWGKFEALEDYCRRVGLTYRRHSDADGEWDGENVFWRPGMAEPTTLLADGDGEPAIRLVVLREALKKGCTLAGVVADLEARAGAVPAFALVP